MPENGRSKEREVPPRPVVKRRGSRRGAGADTPSGPDTDRSVIPEKREQAEGKPRRSPQPDEESGQ